MAKKKCKGKKALTLKCGLESLKKDTKKLFKKKK